VEGGGELGWWVSCDEEKSEERKGQKMKGSTKWVGGGTRGSIWYRKLAC